MLNIFKDLLNIKNWIKAFKNPKKFKKVILVRFFSYPSSRVRKIKFRPLRNIFILFWQGLSKKNNSLNYFFFSKFEKNKDSKIFFEIKTENDWKHLFSSLKENGIVIINDILPGSEVVEIKKQFSKIENENQSDWMDGPKDLSKTSKVKLTWAKDDINKYKNLLKYSDLITNEVYGSKVEPSIEFYNHEVKDLPESVIVGENSLHMDRFIPNLKMYYSPYEIPEWSAPFQYVIGSHKIDRRFVSHWINSKNFQNLNDEKNFSLEYLKNFKKEKILKSSIKANSLVAAFTNGLHCRSPFEKNNMKRKVAFLHYGSFNKLSLLNFYMYNKNSNVKKNNKVFFEKI